MLYLIRCNDIFSDPRAMKYVKYLEDTKRDFTLIGWDRDNVLTDCKHHKYLKKKAGYNVGGIKAVKNRIRWMWFVLKSLIKEKSNKPILHACDLDAAFPAVVYKMLFNKNAVVIFDIFDWFSASMNDQGAIILAAFKFMEKYAAKRSDYIIICEKERIDQIQFPVSSEKLYVLPNIPYFNDNSFLVKDEKFLFDNDKTTFAYVGGFTTTRCLKEIISLAEEGIINLLIAGYGNSDMENRLSTTPCHNIKYYGTVKYSDGLNIMYNADIVYAMYSKVIPNHIYAAPNKFYEALFLGKPLFTTEGTIVEKKVKELNTGFTSEETLEEIQAVIKSIKSEEIALKGKTAAKLWEERYQSYTHDFMTNDYQMMLNNQTN